jgi:protein required for attachment to host cells
MAELKNGTWVLIADGEKALYLRNITDAENPHLEVVRKEEQENPSTREQGTDRPGRMPDDSQHQRSAMNEADWHRMAKERFARDLAEHLYDLAYKDAFDRIVLVAPPRVLGELRENLHREVTSRVVAELPKDLTHHPVDEIERTLVKALGGGD